jgi:hypothetical protein
MTKPSNKTKALAILEYIYKQEREIREEFKDDLDALLKKYNATMFMGDEGQVEVCIAAKFDAEGVCTQEYIEIELGEYFEQRIK